MPSSKPSPAELTLLAQERAYLSWAQTENRTERTAPARHGLEERFLREADGDPQRAAYIRKAYYARLARQSAESRRKARAHLDAADAADAQLRAGGAA